MPAFSRPTSRPSSTSIILGESCIERELIVAASNAEKNRSIQVNELQTRGTVRPPRAMSVPPIASKLMLEKADRKFKKRIVVDPKMKTGVSFSSADQDYQDLPPNPDSRQGRGGAISLGIIDDLMDNLTNTIKVSIFQLEENRKSLALETRGHNGSQLVLM